MTGLDYFVLGVTGLSLLFGLLKGFVRSIMGLAATVAGLALAVMWYAKLAALIRGWVETRATAELIAFLALFISILLIGVGLGRALRKGLEKAHLSWIDHLAGGAFGLLRGWLICSVIYVALTAFPAQLQIVAQARLAPYLIKGAEILTHATSNTLRHHFLEGYEQLRTGWEHYRQGSES